METPYERRFARIKEFLGIIINIPLIQRRIEWPSKNADDFVKREYTEPVLGVSYKKRDVGVILCEHIQNDSTTIYEGQHRLFLTHIVLVVLKQLYENYNEDSDIDEDTKDDLNDIKKAFCTTKGKYKQILNEREKDALSITSFTEAYDHCIMNEHAFVPNILLMDSEDRKEYSNIVNNKYDIKEIINPSKKKTIYTNMGNVFKIYKQVIVTLSKYFKDSSDKGLAFMKKLWCHIRNNIELTIVSSNNRDLLREKFIVINGGHTPVSEQTIRRIQWSSDMSSEHMKNIYEKWPWKNTTEKKYRSELLSASNWFLKGSPRVKMIDAANNLDKKVYSYSDKTDRYNFVMNICNIVKDMHKLNNDIDTYIKTKFGITSFKLETEMLIHVFYRPELHPSPTLTLNDNIKSIIDNYVTMHSVYTLSAKLGVGINKNSYSLNGLKNRAELETILQKEDFSDHPIKYVKKLFNIVRKKPIDEFLSELTDKIQKPHTNVKYKEYKPTLAIIERRLRNDDGSSLDLSKVDVEHILPQSDTTHGDCHKNKIGNLTLLEASNTRRTNHRGNRSIKDSKYKDKKESYKKSDFKMTRSIYDEYKSEEFGDTDIDKRCKDLSKTIADIFEKCVTP